MDDQPLDRKKISVARMPISGANRIVAVEHYLHRSVYPTGNVAYSVVYDGVEGTGTIIYGYPVFHELGGLLWAPKARCGCPLRCSGMGHPLDGECPWVLRRTQCFRCGSRGWRGHLSDTEFICPACYHGILPRDAPLAPGELVELKRVWLPPSFPKNAESCAIAMTLDHLREDWPAEYGATPKMVVSYADTENANEGTIYLASGFRRVGTVPGRRMNPGAHHGRWHERKDLGVGTGAGKIMYLRVLDWNYHLDWWAASHGGRHTRAVRARLQIVPAP